MKIVETARRVLRRTAARARIACERGATAVEYGIIASLIAAVLVVAVFFLGQETNRTFECTGDSMVALSNQC